MKLLSEDTLTHYGTPGMKHGVRRWQYLDGRFNEEGKERYFGAKSSNKEDKKKFKGLFDNNEYPKYEMHENFMVKKYPGTRIYRKKGDFFNEPLGTLKNMRMVDKNGNYTKEYSDAYNSGKNIVERLFSDVKPEGSIFGSKSEKKDIYNPIKGLGKHFTSESGANKTDKFSEKLLKTIANAMTFGMTGKLLGNDKVVRNSQKLGRNDSSFKAFAKQILMGNLGSDRYNIRRSKGQGMLRSYFGAKIIDRLKNLFTLGQNTYRQKENLGLEHSE